MHIALVTHNVHTGDGQAQVNREFVRFTLAEGHRVTLLADRVDAGIVEAGATWRPVHPVVPRPNLLKVPIFALRADRALAALRPHPDAVLANGFVLWGAWSDVNVVHFVHGAWGRSPVHTARLRRGLYGWYQRAYTRSNASWEQRAFRRARRLVAVSEGVQSELVAAGVAPERVRVVPNGVDTEAFRPGSEDRGALGVPEAVPLALFVGDIKTPRKNLDGVLRALVRVPALHLAVVGRTEGSPYPAMAAALGVGDRVKFLGFRRDVASLMRAADFFVFPSRYEPFSLVVLEAMASGLPVVTARAVGAANLVSPHSGFVLEDAEDGEGLVRALTALALDRDRCGEMGRAARATAEAHTWNAMARAYLDLCAEAAATRSSGRGAA